MRIVDLLADGGDDGSETTHCECRTCGTNVEPSTEACPNCGGTIAVYRL